ncbi:hypothetical protein C7212DRAFT_309000, partial [Tuber magnatum]
MATAVLNGLGPYLPLTEQYRHCQSSPCGKLAGSRQQSMHLLDGCFGKRPKVSDDHENGDDDEIPFNYSSPTSPHTTRSMDLPAESP